MKIDTSNIPVDGGMVRNSAAAIAKTAQPAAADAQTLVTLSPQSTRSLEMSSRMSTATTFDASRLEELKQAIRSGGIKIDVSKIADGLINNVGMLLASKG